MPIYAGQYSQGDGGSMIIVSIKALPVLVWLLVVKWVFMLIAYTPVSREFPVGKIRTLLVTFWLIEFKCQVNHPAVQIFSRIFPERSCALKTIVLVTESARVMVLVLTPRIPRSA